MSIVGPRPALPTQSDLIMLRSESGAGVLRPGLTGLAQVSAYDGMPISVKAKLDAEYACLISLVGDLKIIARTVGYLFRQPPIY
jgi:O-antigen biosynthesis protein WbqP